MINFNDLKSEKARWVSLFIDKNKTVYFYSLAIEYIPQEAWNKIKGKSITHDISRIEDHDSVMCGFFCIAFIEHMKKSLEKLC